MCRSMTRVFDVCSLQPVSAPEEAPAEAASEKPSDTGEDSVPEDAAEGTGRSGPSGKKETASSKGAVDGKLVKGEGLGQTGGPCSPVFQPVLALSARPPALRTLVLMFPKLQAWSDPLQTCTPAFVQIVAW